jgi:predicted TIM-barrel fold metal-dependent hydrolase
VTAPELRGVVAVAADLAAPVSITFEIEDDRQHHPLFKPGELEPGEIAAAIRAYPAVNFVLERISPAPVRKVKQLAGDAANWYVDISGRNMLGATVHQGIADLLDWIGPDRVLLGTGMAIQYPRAPFLKLDSLNLDPNALRKIKGENAAALLRIAR